MGADGLLQDKGRMIAAVRSQTRHSSPGRDLKQYGFMYRSEGSTHQRPHYEFDECGSNGLVNLPMHHVIDVRARCD